MSDVQTRPVARGGRPSAARGGRGGFSSRGARSSRTPNTNGSAKHDQEPTSLPTLDDQGEIADLNKAHGSKIPIVKELFPDWSEVDILYALKETDGDETLTIERIIDGSISQWGEVSNQKKDRTKSKAKDTFTTTTGADAPASNNSRNARGGRPEGARGRGRATERGSRGAARGRSAQPATNGSRPKDGQPLSVPTDESNAWDTAKNTDDGGWATAAAATSWEPAAPSDPAPAASSNASEPAKSAVIPQGTSKTWASMLRQSVVVPKPAPPPPREPSAPKQEPALEPLPAATDAAPAPETEPEQEPETIAELSAEPQTEHAPADDATVVVPEVALPPSDDQLTKTNLEQVADSSHPPATETAASEAADSWDPRAAAGSATATPISASQAQHQAHKAPSSGYAASAIKATERAPVPRTAAHPQRRFLDQQEAVRMPGAASQALERATVQFGAFNLNGTEDDIDGDREEPETRAQPPADSPVAQPRASLPPAPQAVPDAYTAQKPVSSLPPGATPTGPQVPPTAPGAQQAAAQAAPQPPTQPAAQQYGRFGQAAQEQQPAFPPKPFDSYNQGSQPSAAQSHFDGFPSQQQSQTQPQSQQPGGPYSSAADQYSSYYTADQQNRAPYNAYYAQNYGQQAGQGQEGGLASRGGFGAYGAAQGDLASQYPQSANQSRFGAAVAHDQNSGPPTPVPATTQGPPASQNHPQAHVAQQQHGSQFYSQQAPYYNQYYQNYNNPSQFGNYGGFGPYGKAGGYGQPQHYQQTPYDHASTAAGGYPQTGLHRGDSGTGASLGDYGRSGSAQPGAQPGLASGGFSSMHDSFGRTSSYGTQAGQSFNAASTQPGASNNDDLKPFGDGKSAPGPSPSMAGTARPGSATNTVPSQAGGLPPPQSQQGMGAYAAGFQNHLQGHGLHGSQSGSTGYGSAQGGQQNAPYTGYGGFGGGSYYNSQQQQPRGWAGQYGGGGGGNY